MHQAILGHLPRNTAKPNNWLGMNCMMCTSRGEPRPDAKQRLGCMLAPDGSVKAHCFRCGFACSWHPGQVPSARFREFMHALNMDSQVQQHIVMQCMALRRDADAAGMMAWQDPIAQLQSQTAVKLPDQCRHVTYWAKQPQPPAAFLAVLDYIAQRNVKLLAWHDNWHWSPTEPDRIIAPIVHFGHVLGWIGRLAREPKHAGEPRYLAHNTGRYLFNADALDIPWHESVIVVEGLLDAIAVQGVAILGNEVTQIQDILLSRSRKRIIVMPDRDAAGQLLIDQALTRNWWVSMPDAAGIAFKDAHDLAATVGSLAACKMIFDQATNSALKINMRRTAWCRS